MKKVLVVMGSDSDLKVMEKCVDRLKSFDIPTEVRICSAHRTPAVAEQLAKNAAAEGFGVIIAAAGKAAHLGGVLAAYTTLPVIGVPMATSVMGGMDSLLSIVQMPKGIPVATVAIDGADNAAILAAQMIALSNDALAQKLAQFKADMAAEVTAKDEKVRAQIPHPRKVKALVPLPLAAKMYNLQTLSSTKTPAPQRALNPTAGS